MPPPLVFLVPLVLAARAAWAAPETVTPPARPLVRYADGYPTLAAAPPGPGPVTFQVVRVIEGARAIDAS
jgi:hypothetical protein